MDYASILMLVAFFGIVYFVMIRPENKKEKALKEMREKLEIGDEIMTIGGIYGKIVSVKEDRVVIRTGADNMKLEMAKESIGQKINQEPAKPKEKQKATPKNIKKLGEKEAEPVKEAVKAAEETAEAAAEEAAAPEA